MPLIIDGVYRHYKGPTYRVLGLVKHSETLDELVYYECLYNNPNGQLWVRPRAMFESTIVIDGVEQQRFAFTGEVKA
jgi:hypothetical protein